MDINLWFIILFTMMCIGCFLVGWYIGYNSKLARSRYTKPAHRNIKDNSTSASLKEGYIKKGGRNPPPPPGSKRPPPPSGYPRGYNCPFGDINITPCPVCKEKKDLFSVNLPEEERKLFCLECLEKYSKEFYQMALDIIAARSNSSPASKYTRSKITPSNSTKF